MWRCIIPSPYYIDRSGGIKMLAAKKTRFEKIKDENAKFQKTVCMEM